MMLGAGSPDSAFDTITLRDDYLTASSRNAASERAIHSAEVSERLARCRPVTHLGIHGRDRSNVAWA